MSDKQNPLWVEQIEKICHDGKQKRKEIADTKDIILSEIERTVEERMTEKEEHIPTISVAREALLRDFSEAAKCGNVQKMAEIKDKLIALGNSDGG